MLIKSIYFWVATVILLAIIGVSGVKIIPPIVDNYQDNQQKLADSNIELDEQKKFLAAVNTIKNDPETLETLYDKALLALPETADSEILMLQLDGLLKSLKLGSVAINVPLQSADAAETEQNNIEVTLSGDISYDQMTKLLPKLKTFSRWNKISSFDITRDVDKYNSSITLKAFFQPGSTGVFSGNSKILEQAETLFSDFESYATNPDINTEGTFGRPNPFTP